MRAVELCLSVYAFKTEELSRNTRKILEVMTKRRMLFRHFHFYLDIYFLVLSTFILQQRITNAYQCDI